MFVSLTQVCIVYVVKKLRHSRGLGQLMGVARKRNACSSSTNQQKESCVAYVETRTNS